MNKFLCLAASLILAGCATWSHPTKGEAGFEADTYECDKDTAAVQDNLRRAVMHERCMKQKGWKPG